MSLEQRIRNAENGLFAAVDADVDEFFLELARTGLRVRVLSSGSGPALVLLHGGARSAPWVLGGDRGGDRLAGEPGVVDVDEVGV
jgi:hypothetical protein